MSTSGRIMNCEEYKQAVAADPAFEDDTGHAALCQSCADFRAQMISLDKSIASAMTIDVPPLQMPELPAIDALADNVVSLQPKRKPTFTMPTWIGIAAGLALAAVIGVQFVANDSLTDQALATEILAHVDHELWTMQVTDESVTDARLSEVMAANEGTMSTGIGLVSYAQSCIINGRTIPHLVVQGKDGPITVLLMPEEMVSMPVELDGQGVTGMIFPMGDGSVAIVGDRNTNFEEIREKVTTAVEWSI